jgi:hypothetical protein
MHKVIVRIKGGLGNQMFCYSAAKALAMRNECELVIDPVSGFKYDSYKRKYALDNFNIKSRVASKYEMLEPFARIRSKIKRKISQKFEGSDPTGTE